MRIAVLDPYDNSVSLSFQIKRGCRGNKLVVPGRRMSEDGGEIDNRILSVAFIYIQGLM